MKIIVDAMGGDNAPLEIVKGALQAQKRFGADIVFTGDETAILDAVRACGLTDLPDGAAVIPTTETVEMCDDPATVFRRKKNTSMGVGLTLLKNGGGDAMGHRLWLAAHRYTPVWEDSIPLCMAEDVAGTPFDFTAEKAVGRDIGVDCAQLRYTGGYDHNFVLDPGQGLRLAARLTGEKSGVVMETWTEKPGVQLYAANFLHTDGQTKTGAPYGPRQAVYLETQFFPDSPNHPEWGDVILRPGQVYERTTEYRFDKG